MGEILESFLAYLHNTPEEQIEKDWAEIKESSYGGSTIDEFLEQCWCHSSVHTDPWKLNLSNKTHKSEDFFGFFYIFGSHIQFVSD
ncbi:MAG: hypothetical protein QM654_11560 [Dysgonamonadaceae bacterium]